MAKSRPQKIRSFLLDRIPEHPKDIVSRAMQVFNVTRPTIHQHLNKLIRDKQVLKTGRTFGAAYYLVSAFDKKMKFKIEPGLAEHQVWNDYFRPTFTIFPKNILEICEYSFEEILNNAIDHSQGHAITITTRLKENHINIEISDDGIGIFRKIKTAFNLADERDSVLQLSKGKLTTDPENHTGEGIFFTSRVVDIFFIWSFELNYYRENLEEEDWYLDNKEKPFHGTFVSMAINIDTTQTPAEVFKRFSTLEEEQIARFDKTHFKVDLAKREEERYVSRSQAKKLLSGLEQFSEVVMDFKNVQTVGQGFVDQVFRVFRNKYPDIKITYINANENVKFMIERGLPTAKK